MLTLEVKVVRMPGCVLKAERACKHHKSKPLIKLLSVYVHVLTSYNCKTSARPLMIGTTLL